MKKHKIESTLIGTKNHQREGRAGIMPAEVFRALLRHERRRSDRDGSEFSLVVFNVTSLNSNGRGVQMAADRMRAKIRSIDELGWIHAQGIGVLLPVTNIEGGRMFASRVGELMPYSVYAYPAHWPPRTGENDCDDTSHPKDGEDAFEKVVSRATPVWKSLMDVGGSLTSIILLSPVFLLLTLYIKAVSPGRVFFKQKRVGYRGKLFTFIKFRTMHEGSDPASHREHLKQLIKSGRPMEKLDGGRDPRIIPGGRIIRKMCLDELPQLFNVLRGEMSLVGPRPCIPYEAEEYLRWHAARFDTLPGMTGLWQVSGKDRLSFEQMIRLDISYANRMSPLLDLKILLLTGPTIIEMVLAASAKRIFMPTLRSTGAGATESDGDGTVRDA